ncbi:PIG-L family deacetylase [Candidatus Parcubacteria bacterium]|nr:PIG-L family deacetylase [Candidatus Parcubacteria bacterium]
MTKKHILIVAAHPDDEVLGCGATIAKLASEGSKVFCLLLNKGRTKETLKKGKVSVEKEAMEASKVLGVSRTFFASFPDQKYDSVPLLEIIQAIEKVKKEVKPEIIFTHHLSDLNLDHKITCQAVLTAFRPLKGEKAKKIYGFDVQESSKWLANGFVPNTFFDVSLFFNKKIDGLKKYQSELRQYPHPRSLEAVIAVAKYWGIVSGQEKTEAFVLLRGLE